MLKAINASSGFEIRWNLCAKWVIERSRHCDRIQHRKIENKLPATSNAIRSIETAVKININT